MKKQSTNKKSGNLRKTLLACLIVLGLACVGWLVFILFGNNYKSNAMQMKVNTIVASRLSNIMLDDYLTNWVRTETEQLGTNAKGELVSTEDAAQVVKWRQEFYKENGASELLQQLVGEIKDNVASLKLTPARYRDTQENFKTAYGLITQLSQLTENPGDSIVELANKLEELNANLDKALEPTDFNFWVSYDDIREVTDRLAAQIKDKNLAEAIGKETSRRPNSAVNMLKYKKMGFKELPKGKGVLYHVLTEGKGPKPKDDTKVVLHYEGKLMDGTIFDSSYKRGETVTMRPSQTVPGFWQSLVNMPVGSKWEIYIPYSQAYGERAAGAVKPFSDLFFTIEVQGLEE